MYILEGNIGAGKSTFLKMIHDHIPEIKVSFEPLHNWQSQIYGQSLLANYMEKPRRWSYTFETFAMMCRVKEHVWHQQEQKASHIIERSIFSGHYCFSLNGYANGFMSHLEWKMYNDWFSFLIPQHCKAPLGFIYLQTNPEVAFTRIKKRNRLAEKKITYTYIEQLHDYHEKFLIEKQELLPMLQKVPVLIIDCNEEFEDNLELFNKHCQTIKKFIHATSFDINNR